MKFSAFVTTSVVLSASCAGVLAAPSTEPDLPSYTIHPNGNTSKCIDVVGGDFVLGAAVDINDCNGSATQKWTWGPFSHTISNVQVSVTNPATDERFCMDIPTVGPYPEAVDLVNGAKLILKTCEEAKPYYVPVPQSFSYPSTSEDSGRGPVMSYTVYVGHPLCVDLTNGSTTNGNELQMWECSRNESKPRKNQVWTLSEV